MSTEDRPDSSSGSGSEITGMFSASSGGDAERRAALIERLYPELKRIAGLHMSRERPDHTLQPTALVNEFFLDFARRTDLKWQNRAHFLAAASQAMKRLLIDHARGRSATKRGGPTLRVQLEGLDLPGRVSEVDTHTLKDLLDRLEAEEPRMAQVVELRCFGGLTHAEIGEILGLDERTIKRDWQVARAWLYGHLKIGP